MPLLERARQHPAPRSNHGAPGRGANCIREQQWDRRRIEAEVEIDEESPAESDGETYRLCKCLFFGSFHVNTVFRSDSPIVRGSSQKDPREKKTPLELLAIRKELRLDFGRIDYVILDGRVVIYDVNKTPTVQTATPRMVSIAKRLAMGLEEYEG